MSRLVWMLMLSGLLAAGGCERTPADGPPGKVTSEDVRRDAAQAVDTAAEFSQQTKEEFQKTLDARLQELDARIAKLREKGHDLKDQAKADWDRKMADLEAKRDTARAKLAEVRQSSDETWENVRDAALSAWGELDKASRSESKDF
jgi:TolA-binding protein